LTLTTSKTDHPPPASRLPGDVADAKTASWCMFWNNNQLSTSKNKDLTMNRILR
jgi:hypothetical protein